MRQTLEAMKRGQGEWYELEVSCFAQIRGGQRRNPTLTDTLSQSVRVIQFDLLNRNPSGCPRSLAPKHVGRKEVPCKILQGESLSRLLQGAAAGAVASIVIGFSWGGWVTGTTANRLAAERADTAVVAALTPVCVEKFLQNSDAQANLAVIMKIPSNWEQGEYVQKGQAIDPDDERPAI
jgi:hypothetical protein